VTPHVTQNKAVTKTGKTRNSAIDERITRHPGYGMSQSRRAMIECIFGWGKQHGTKPSFAASVVSPPTPAQSDRRQPDPHSQTGHSLARPASRPQNTSQLSNTSPNKHPQGKRKASVP
jgi:hypothetical protein